MTAARPPHLGSGPSPGLIAGAIAAVPTLWLAAFFLAPLALTVAISFAQASFAGIEPVFTLDNYREALSGFYLAVFARTVAFAVTASALCLIVAYPVALFLARLPAGRRIWALIPILVPYFSSFLIRVMSLETLMARGGPIDAMLPGAPLDLLNTPTAVFIGIVYAYLPIAVIPIFVVLDRIPPAVTEAARDLGARPWRTFLFVTLPLSRPGLATAALLTAAPMMGEMVIPDLLGGGRGLLMGKALSSQYLQAQNYPLGSAMAALILIAVGVIVAGLARLTRGFAGAAAGS